MSNSWLDSLTDSELEVVRVTLKCSIENDEIGTHTKQHARLMLNEVEDYLWNKVCQNIPMNLDQDQTAPL